MKKHIHIILSATFGLLLAYTFSSRYLNLFHQPKSIMPVIIIACWLVSTFLVYLLITRFLLHHASKYNSKTLIIITSIAIILSGLLIFGLPHFIPEFPRVQTLKITALGNKNPLSDGFVVDIVSFKNGEIAVPLDSMQFGQQWSYNGSSLSSTQKQPAVISYNGLLNETIAIIFRITPDSGLVEITFSNQANVVDLYSSEVDTKKIELRKSSATPLASLSWKTMSRIWQGAIIILVLADFLCLAFFILLYEVIILAGFLENSKMRSRILHHTVV